MSDRTFMIFGKIINKQTKLGISALRVEAWDKDLVIHDFVGEAVTDKQGAFRIEFTSDRFRELFLDRKPDLFFKVFHEGKQIHSTENSVIWNYENSDREIVIEIELPQSLEQRDLGPSAEEQKYSLMQEMLKNRVPDEASRLDAARIWLESRRNPDQFRKRVKDNSKLASQADAILFTLEVADRVGGQLEVIRALEQRFDQDEFSEAAEIAHWETAEWEDLIRKEKIKVPESFSTGDGNASVRGFTNALRTAFERAYPKQAIRSHFDKHAESYAWGKSVRDILKKDDSLDPSIPVVRLEREHTALFTGEDGQKARRGLAAFQRLHRLTRRLDPIQALVGAGLTSARAIAHTDPADFAQRFAPAFADGVDEAATTHARALRASSLAKLTFSALSDQFNRTSLAVLKSPEPSIEQGQALATWRDLFGSEDLGFCECAHCKSIFGPAAYLFDMLLFLDQFAGPPQTKGPIIQLPEGWPRPQENVHRITALTFLNCVERPEQLVEWVQDDPAFLVGSENTIGVSLEMATAILQEREALGGRFSSLRQVYDIEGVGPDTLHDIIHTSWGEAGPIAVELALKFLNSAQEAQEICRQIKDDPEYVLGPERVRGVTLAVAERIIDHRDSMEVGGEYTSLRQVAEAPGVGPDTLHDIIYSFYEKVGQLITDGDWIFGGTANNVVALAEYNGRLFGATSDNKLWMRDALPEDLPWHLIGNVNDVIALSCSYDGKLFIATDKKIRMSEFAAWVKDWDEIGHANSVVAMTSLAGKLYAANSDNKLWIRDPAPTDLPWTHIGHANSVVAMTSLEGKLYAATSDNKLWIRDPDPVDLPWTHIGHANSVVAMTSLDGKLYSATSDNKLWIREPDPTDLPWTQIGRTEQVTALAAAEGLLFAATSDHRLLMRGAVAKDRPWVRIGEAKNVVGMTAMSGKLYAATSDNKLVLKRHPPMDVPYTKIVDADNIAAITSYDGIIYAATSNNELVSRPAIPSNAPWSPKGIADRVISMASQYGRFVIVNEDNRLMVRSVAPSDSPWTDAGDAKGAIGLAATNSILFAVTGNNELWMREFPVWQMSYSLGRTLLDYFRERRPDVPALPLSCDTTNIEVPHIDLVNELLADLIQGSICFGMHPSSSLYARSTTGISEERRAWPEHRPPTPVLVELRKAAWPWTLPYDYERDHAEQARRALPVNGNEVIEALWRFGTFSDADGGASAPETRAWSLAQYALQLTEAEISLLTVPSTVLADAWGNEVAESVAFGQSPTVAAMQRAGRFEYSVLENALETQFVRQAATSGAVRIQPPGFCDPEQLRLNALVDDLPAILDRLHRFERLRRKCGWSSIQLDDVLGAAGQALGREELLIVGLVLFLQQRLDVSPEAVLALFRDPSSQRPFTLRPEKRVLSAFERLFGTEPVNLPNAADENAADVVVSSIAARVGVGSDEVLFVLTKGYAGIGGTTFTAPLDILRATNSLAAWEATVAAVFRVATFAEALDLSLTDFIALVELSKITPLLKPGMGDSLSKQLIDAVSFINLAQETSNWPIPASEVLYLTTDDDSASRVHAPDAIKAGNLLKKLHAEVSRVSEDIETAGGTLAKVQKALSELLGEASPQGPDGQPAPEKAIDRIQRMIEWSSVFPEFKAQVIAGLPGSAVLELEVKGPGTAELAEAVLAWSDVLDIGQNMKVLPELFRRHLAQMSDAAGVDESSSEYQNALQALRNETEAMFHEPGMNGVSSLSDKIQPLLTLIGVPAAELEDNAKTIARNVLSAATLTVSSLMEPVRTRAAQRWLPALTAAALRNKRDTIVIELFAAAFSLDAAETRRLLAELLRDPGIDQTLIRAFVSRNGSTERVDASLVQASYVNLKEGSGSSSTGGAATTTTAPSEIQLAVARIEPSLQMDWTASPPPAGINPGRFQVTLSTWVATAALKTSSGIRRLIVESTGRVTLTLQAGTHEALVLVLNAAGRLQRQEWRRDAVKTFLDAFAPNSDTVRMVLTFASMPDAAVGDATIVAAPQTLRVLLEANDGEFDALRTGMLTPAIVRFDKAARLVRGLSLPPAAWPTLANLPDDRGIDLNALPITGGNSFDLWQKVVSLKRIWDRSNDETDVAALYGIMTGSAVSVDALARALGLARTELQDLLKLLNIPLESDGKEARITSDWRALAAALRLSDLARQAGLPLAAISGWLTALARDFYQWALGALRVLRPKEEWLEVLQYIHDPVRENLRDALIAWLVTHARTGADGAVCAPFPTPEAISDYLFTDVQMSACMPSSRVQFGYAAVQRYIDAVRLGFEAGPQKADQQERFEREWTWRRFYRLWEANRRVFAFPENWLEPDLRPDKTPFFQELEEKLMEGPLTTQSAENALADYLGKLVDVARPEIIGIIHESEQQDDNSPIGFRDPDLHGTHVFGRSRSQPHQLYYRRRMPVPDNRWTPWERIEAELPGTHFIPVIAFQRLYLISAEFGLGKSLPEPCEQKGATQTRADSAVPQQTANVVFSWIEHRKGKWTRIKRSELLEFDAPEIRATQMGLDNSWDDVFPSDQFRDVPYSVSNDEAIDRVKIFITYGATRAGYAPVMCNPASALTITLEKSGNDITLGTIYGVADGRNRKTVTLTHYPSSTFLASAIEGLDFSYSTSQALSGPGDLCIIRKIEWSFRGINGAFYTGKKEKASDYRGLVILANKAAKGSEWEGATIEGETWSQPITVDTTLDQMIRWDDEGVRSCFKVSVVGEQIPPNVYAIHAEPSSVSSDRQLKLKLILSGGVKVLVAGTPEFQFTGFEEYRQVEGKWPSDWIKGKGSRTRCLGGTTEEQPLLSIDLFSDGTVRSAPPLQNSPYVPRGGYKETDPWRQRFRCKRTAEPFIFYAGDEVTFDLGNSYDVVVQNQGQISTEVSPKVLDEFSDLSDGVTLFVERSDEIQEDSALWLLRVFWHPQATGFLRLLQAHGIPRLLAHGAQALQGNDLPSFFNNLSMQQAVLVEPGADVDFSIKGAYSDYNWELFFHAPLLIAQRLSDGGQFEDAERWFKLLFDPAMGRLNTRPVESFQTRPLREASNQRLDDMLHLLHDQEVRAVFKEQVDRFNRYPYQPHLIARSRLSAYQKTLVMKYLNHLIAWGDELFRRAYATDNRTDLENAGSRYDLVAKLLGKRPEVLPAQARDSIFSFDELWKDKEYLDLWDPLIKIEDYIPEYAVDATTGRPEKVMPEYMSAIAGRGRPGGVIPNSGGGGTGRPGGTTTDPGIGVSNDGEGIPEYLYFCIPHNDELLKYWDTLADRLGKLRSCRDIEGVRRTLSLYGRRIDPGLLVRATAMGLDIDVLLGYLSAPIPRYRFNSLMQRARGACDRAQAFGQELLSAIEKREAEELARLRSKHEVALLRASKRVRDEQVSEAEESLEALRRSRESAEARHRFYSSRKRLNAPEAAENEALEKASQHEQLAASAAATAADLAFIPGFPVSLNAIGEVWSGSTGSGYQAKLQASQGINYDFGGQFLSKIEENKARGHRNIAERNRTEAARIGREAQHDRRWDDWQLQKELAEKDMVQIDRQIASAEIRVRIAEIEQENQMQQIDQAATVDAYLRDKFTNAKLYRWMESRLSRLYYQQYRLAYDLALKAQRAMRYELGLEEDSLFPDTWDPSHRGMEAASDLQHELEKLETRYMDSWRREHEKQKTFSLADRRPLEFLELRQTGKCVIRILEHEFDEDEPGDYFRRIKQVSVNIPCVVGPDVSVNARLTLLRSEIRTKPHSTGNYARAEGLEGANDDRFRDYSGGADHIVTSTGVNDTGQFDTGLGGDRLLPFEGAGVISTWQIDLPKETNHFDRASLADVKLRILYTARDGGDAARTAALEERSKYLKSAGREVLIPLASSFSNAWVRFTNENTASRELALEFGVEHLPFALRDSKLAGVNLYFEVAPDDTLTLADPNAGTLDYPLTLDGIVRFTPKTLVSFGGTFSLILASDSPVPRRGWAVLIVKQIA